jgi:hypothetical protein
LTALHALALLLDPLDRECHEYSLDRLHQKSFSTVKDKNPGICVARCVN